MNLSVVNTPCCRCIHSGKCVTMRVATNLELSTNRQKPSGLNSWSTHTTECEKGTRTSQQEFRGETNDAVAGWRGFTKQILLHILNPLIHRMMTTRMSNAQRFPPAGEEDEHDIPDPKPRHQRSDEAFPTQQMLDYKKKLKEAGRKPEKKKMLSEQHFDDCGEDLKSILHVSLVPESYRDSFQYDSLNDDGFTITGPDFFEFDGESWLGIAYDEPDINHARTFEEYYCMVDQFTYASTRMDQDYVDVAEIMGGEGRTTQVLIRRGFKAGMNFDCVVGCDLMRKDDEEALYRYLDRYKPKVLVMAPQCTGMAGWGSLNAVINPEAHQRSVRISHHLGNICARCAKMQIDGGRHYFLEQPKGSDLFNLLSFRILLTHSTWCLMHMCMVGLKSTRGKLLKKPSELWASHESLLWRFRSRICDSQHEHDKIEGGESKPSQIWTWYFVRLLADGISDLILGEFELSRKLRNSPQTSYPTTGGKPQLPFEVDPSEVDPNDSRLKWSCRACRNQIEKHDTRHTSRDWMQVAVG